MGLLDNLFRAPPPPKTAAIAKERLKIIVTHERGNRANSPDYLPALKHELLEVVRRYVKIIDQDQIKVHLDRAGNCEVLELNITLPDTPPDDDTQRQMQPSSPHV